MGNVWGIAEPWPLAASYGTVGGANVTLTAGTEVTGFTTGAITAPSPGNWYPIIDIDASLIIGAAGPSPLIVAFKLGAGADVDSISVPVANFFTSVTRLYHWKLIGQVSGTAWAGAGSTINVTFFCTTNAQTLAFAGSRAVVQLMRGPDQ